MVMWLGNETLEKGVHFILTYHLLFKSMGKIINKNVNLLYMDSEVKKVFTPKPMISFRSARKMSSYLVRAKLYSEERTKGSFKCGSKRFEVYLNVKGNAEFIFLCNPQKSSVNVCLIKKIKKYCHKKSNCEF